jgi:molecular chaperone GrpE (heat shock protein)
VTDSYRAKFRRPVRQRKPRFTTRKQWNRKHDHKTTSGRRKDFGRVTENLQPAEEAEVIAQLKALRTQVKTRLTRGWDTDLLSMQAEAERLEGRLRKQVKIWESWAKSSNPKYSQPAQARMQELQTVIDSRYDWQGE